MRQLKLGARNVWRRRDLQRAPPAQAVFVIGHDEPDLLQGHRLPTIHPMVSYLRPRSEGARDDAYRTPETGRISAPDLPQ